jgi:pentatricopeptide repeat protein
MIYNKLGGLERCEYFLNRLEKMYQQGGQSRLRPNRYTYSLVLDAIAKSQKPSAAERAETLLNAMLAAAVVGGDGGQFCEPDTAVYNTVLNAWARSKSPQAAERAEGILQTLLKRRREGLSDARPDIVTYNTLLNILARSAKGYAGARKLLDQMEKNRHRQNKYDDDGAAVAPNVISYNILIKALADDFSVSNATEKALAILEAIRKVSADDNVGVPRQSRSNCEIDCVTYSSVLKVISRESTKDQPHYAEKAIGLLQELEAAYDASNDPALAPNSIPYTLVRLLLFVVAALLVSQLVSRLTHGRSIFLTDH